MCELPTVWPHTGGSWVSHYKKPHYSWWQYGLQACSASSLATLWWRLRPDRKGHSGSCCCHLSYPIPVIPSPQRTADTILNLWLRREKKRKHSLSSYHFCSTYYVPGVALVAYIWDLSIFTATQGCRRYLSHGMKEQNTGDTWAMHTGLGPLLTFSTPRRKGQLCTQILSQL